MELTRIQRFGAWWAKREDEACRQPDDPACICYPAGSKVRQYAAMAARTPGAPMVVGCSADSAMQVYVAASAKVAGVEGVVFVPGRKEETAATEYAQKMGAHIFTVRPGYLSQCRRAAKEWAVAYGKPVVRWDVPGAISDAAEQVRNLPDGAKRVVVPTGSGLTVLGVMLGLARQGRPDVIVHAITVSNMADPIEIITKLGTLTDLPSPKLSCSSTGTKYGHVATFPTTLPDGSLLDPYYAAKALPHVRPGDVLWIPGVRPWAAMPYTKKELTDATHAKLETKPSGRYDEG